MKKAEVKFENITKKFNETVAVDNVSCNFDHAKQNCYHALYELRLSMANVTGIHGRPSSKLYLC